MVGIIFALLCAIFLGFSQISLRKSYQAWPPSVSFLFDAILGLLLWVPLAIFMGISNSAHLGEAFIFASISAILAEALVFYALSHGELAVTATVLSTYSVYTIIFSRLFNQEILSLSVLFFIILTILGSIIASFPDKLREKGEIFNKAIIWPFIAAVCIGISDTISKGYINRSQDFSFLLMLGLVQIPIAFTYLKIEKQSLGNSIFGVLNKFKDYKFALLGGLFNIVGTGFLWLSFSYTPASIASPITACSNVLTVLFSKLLFKEKISPYKYIGIVLTFTGIVGIAILKNN